MLLQNVLVIMEACICLYNLCIIHHNDFDKNWIKRLTTYIEKAHITSATNFQSLYNAPISVHWTQCLSFHGYGMCLHCTRYFGVWSNKSSTMDLLYFVAMLFYLGVFNPTLWSLIQSWFFQASTNSTSPRP